MVMTPTLYWHEALSDPDCLVNIYGGDVNVQGLLAAAFTMESTVQWSSPMEDLMKQYAGKIERLNIPGAGAYQGVVDAARALAPVSLPLWSSTKNWMMSAGPAFPLTIMFISIHPTDDVRVPLKNLANAVYSRSVDKVAQTPPNGYVYGIGQTPTGEGTLSIKIGSWFHAKNMYLIDSWTISFSQQVIENGTPLYCEVQLQLSPYRMIDITEYQALFS